MKLKKGVNLLIGAKNIGKTNFLQEEIIPKLDDFCVIDANNEYLNICDKNKHVLSGMTFVKMTTKAFSVISHESRPLIFEDICKYIHSPYWKTLALLMRNKDVYIVFNSIQSANKLIKHLDSLDSVYLFKTIDTKKVVDKFKETHSKKIQSIN